TAYKVGDTVTYNGVSYRCIQPHTAIAGWEPPNTPALWQRQ
ncbi:carbohydrate-binding protein, partial [Amycolatopsis pretoriensis]